jgi:8-amino-7-oxononanoate synthase
MNKHTNSCFFGGTAYLGMPHNQFFKNFVFKGIELFGINHGASRNNKISLDIFSRAESEAAARCGAEAAILVSSGYLAAQLVLQRYFQTHRLIYAPDTHPALWIGNPKPPFISFSEWVEITVLQINSSREPTLIISNSLNNLFPEIYSFDWLRRLDPDNKVILLLDDSHGIGITGEKGEGVFSTIPQLPNVELIVIASMAKALGVDAGVILAKDSVVGDLRSSQVYGGSSPPAPGILYAYVHADEIYKNELKKLRKNIQIFEDLSCFTPALNYTLNFPVFALENATAGVYLLIRGIAISSFPYPDPQGEILNRIVITSTHTKSELEILAAALSNV